MTPARSDNTHILVIGAGVLGLSTARLLQSHFPERKIAIVASEIPSSSSSSSCSTPHSASYASAWAGAHYRPIFPATAQLDFESGLARRTFEVMRKIAGGTPEAGVEIVTGLEFLDSPGQGELGMEDGDVYAGAGDGFRLLKEEEMVEGAKWGCEYQTYCVNVPVYCGYLLRRFEGYGGKVLVRNMTSAVEGFKVANEEFGGEAEVVINCSGSNFGLDPKMKIIRGQTCFVRNPYHRTLTRQYEDGRWATLIPRPLDGGTIVGVSKEIGDLEDKPRSKTRLLLLQQSVECFPDFVHNVDDFEVIQDYVGRRPFREGGLRIEVEELNDGEKRILHGYGAGGRGYELSWGIAERLVQLLKKGRDAENQDLLHFCNA